MPNKIFKIAITCLVVTAHLAALMQFHIIKNELDFGPNWPFQFHLLIGLSCILSLAVPLIRHAHIRIIILLLKLSIILLVGIPFGRDLGVEITLLSAMLVEAVIYLRLLYGALFSTGVIAASVVLQRPFLIWGKNTQAAPVADTVYLLTYLSIVTLIVILLKYHRDKLVPHRELDKRLHEATVQLAEANIKLQEHAAMSEELASKNERKRISREIHDTMAYTLTNLVMMMEAGVRLTNGSDDDDLKTILLEAKDHAKKGLQDVRRVIRALRPIEMKSERGLRAIYKLSKTFEKATNVKVNLHLGDVPWSFGEEEDRTAYRLIQESMTNSLRHGKADNISIFFIRKDGGVLITIDDNGVGADEIEEGFGLNGMRERLKKLGGWLEMATKPRKGFTLSAWLPSKKG